VNDRGLDSKALRFWVHFDEVKDGFGVDGGICADHKMTEDDGREQGAASDADKLSSFISVAFQWLRADALDRSEDEFKKALPRR